MILLGIEKALKKFSLVAQLVKNLPAVWETYVQSLGWEDPLEKGKATHSSILSWRIPWTVQSIGSQESDMTERFSFHFTATTNIPLSGGKLCFPT